MGDSCQTKQSGWETWHLSPWGLLILQQIEAALPKHLQPWELTENHSPDSDMSRCYLRQWCCGDSRKSCRFVAFVLRAMGIVSIRRVQLWGISRERSLVHGTFTRNLGAGVLWDSLGSGEDLPRPALSWPHWFTLIHIHIVGLLCAVFQGAVKFQNCLSKGTGIRLLWHISSFCERREGWVMGDLSSRESYRNAQSAASPKLIDLHSQLLHDHIFFISIWIAKKSYPSG